MRDVFGDNIEQMNLMAEFSEPAGVDSGTASGVDDRSRCRRQMAENELLGARVLELEPAGAQTGVLVGCAIEVQNAIC